jgi:hypothetical protein
VLSACAKKPNPLNFADPPIIRGADVGADDLSGFELFGNLAVVTTIGPEHGREAVIDLAAHRFRWIVEDGDPIPGEKSATVDFSTLHDPKQMVVRDHHDGDFDVYVPYRITRDDGGDDTDQHMSAGIASLAGEDGRGEWLSDRLFSSDIDPKSPEKLKVRPVLASGDTVVAAAGNKKRPRLTTFVIDTQKGSTRWKKDDVWPKALSADTVVVAHSDDSDVMLEDDGAYIDDTYIPKGLAVSDGRTVWERNSDWYKAKPGAADEAHAEIAGQKTYRDRPSGGLSDLSGEIIDIDSGKSVDELDSVLTCRASPVGLACVDGDELTTIGMSDSKPAVSTPYGSAFGLGSSDWEILDVFDDTIAVKDDLNSDRVQAIDADGKLRLESFPGTPKAMNEDFLASCAGEASDCSFYAG